MSARPHVVFFAKVQDRTVLDRVEFYAQDIAVLRDLGCHVTIVTDPRRLVPADLYYVWWWTWAAAPVFYASFLRRPVVISGVFDVWAYPSRPFWHRAAIKYALATANANVFVSQMEWMRVPSQLAVNAPIYAPLCVDTQMYSPSNLQRDPATLLTIAGMHGDNAVRKGVPESIEACAKLRARGHDVNLIVGGEKGSGHLTLARLAVELGVSDYVRFTGLLSLEEKIALMRRCTCYLQPSRFEGFGLSMLEAMSCGSAVIARPGGAVSEVLGNAGKLVAVQGVDALTDAIECVLADLQLRQHYGQSARARALSEFPLSRRRDSLASILAPLISM